jgi:two-component system phosphate regulon response regulator PhoB
MRILCVEDDADSREMMSLLLEQAGYEVVTASNAADGLELARRVSFALIILDNQYELGSGIDLCKKIRRFDSHVPIVFYSGAAYEADIQQAMQAGAQSYLIKPASIRALVQIIEELTLCTSMYSAVE